MKRLVAAPRNVEWQAWRQDAGFEHAQIVEALLMDIRGELRTIAARLNCHETLSIPRLLREIKRNTTKRRKPRKRKE